MAGSPKLRKLLATLQAHTHTTDTHTQLFELLMTLAGSPKLRKLLAPALPELAALCVSYSQMSNAQEEGWLEDPNALIADEESDIVGCR